MKKKQSIHMNTKAEKENIQMNFIAIRILILKEK